MTIASSKTDRSANIAAVRWKVEVSPRRGMNCFGIEARETGQSRVPEPPHMITGVILCNVDIVRPPRKVLFNCASLTEP